MGGKPGRPLALTLEVLDSVQGGHAKGGGGVGWGGGQEKGGYQQDGRGGGRGRRGATPPTQGWRVPEETALGLVTHNKLNVLTVDAHIVDNSQRSKSAIRNLKGVGGQ